MEIICSLADVHQAVQRRLSLVLCKYKFVLNLFNLLLLYLFLAGQGSV